MAWFVILELLQPYVTAKAKLTLWIFWGILGYTISFLSRAETPALALFFWAIVSCLLVFRGRRVLFHAGLAGLWTAGACAFRYAYWPLAVVPPLTIIASSLIGSRLKVGTDSERHVPISEDSKHGTARIPVFRRAPQLISGILCGLMSCGLLAALIVSQQWRTGHTSYLDATTEQSSAYLWENLLKFNAVPATMFEFDWNYKKLWMKVPALQSIPVAMLIWGFSILLIITVVLQWQWSDVKAVRDAKHAVLRTFLAAAISTGILTIAMLCYLSVRIAPETWQPGGWTYVEQARYHVPYAIFLYVALVAVCDGNGLGNGSRTRSRLRQLAMILMFGASLFAFATLARTWFRYVMKNEVQRTASLVVDGRLVYAAVRNHIQAGRAVLFLYPEKESPVFPKSSYEFMAGACTMTLEAAAQSRLVSRQPLAVMVIGRDEDGNAALSVAQSVIRNKGTFRPIGRVNDGWLHEAVVQNLD